MMKKSKKNKFIFLMYKSSLVVVLLSISIFASIAYVTTIEDILFRIIVGGFLFGVSLIQIYLYKRTNKF